MEFVSCTFAKFLLLSHFIYCLARKSRFRRYVLFATSLVFVYSQFATIAQTVPLAVLCIAGYLLLILNRRIEGVSLFNLSILTLVTLFLVLKKYTLLPQFLRIETAYSTVGMSYILFRIIHLLHEESHETKRIRVSLFEYLHYLLSFFTFLAGPIQRYEQFAEQGREVPRTALLSNRLVLAHLGRTLTGYIKTIIIAPAILLFHDRLLAHETAGISSLVPVMATAVANYTFYLYFNFSGYMDLVIGIAFFFDFSLPENFRNPFEANSLLDLWGRWHITLSEWFRDFLFNPLTKSMAGTFRSKATLPYLVVIAYFITFLLMGLWHGSTKIFVVYGLFLAIGVSINKLYQILMVKHLGREQYKGISQTILYKKICQGATFAYFSIGLTCLWMDFPHWKEFFGRLGPIGTWVVFLFITLVFAAVGLVGQGVSNIAKLIRQALPLELSGTAYQLGFVGARVYLLTMALLLQQGQRLPEFVYKAF